MATRRMASIKSVSELRDHAAALGIELPVDDELATGARARLQRHLAECPECRGVLRSLERMLVRLSGVPWPAGSEAPDLAERIRARLRDSRVD